MKILTAEGASLKEQYEMLVQAVGGCSCHLCAQCSVCVHPGNPANLAKSEDLWEEGKVYLSWAYTDKEQEKAEHNARYFEHIKHLRRPEHIKFTIRQQYAHTTFNGELLSEEAQALTSAEILLLMDYGNLCFGGSCSKSGTTFSGSYNKD